MAEAASKTSSDPKKRQIERKGREFEHTVRFTDVQVSLLCEKEGLAIMYRRSARQKKGPPAGSPFQMSAPRGDPLEAEANVHAIGHWLQERRRSRTNLIVRRILIRQVSTPHRELEVTTEKIDVSHANTRIQ